MNKKLPKIPAMTQPLQWRAWYVRNRVEYKTIREYASALIQLIRYHDEDGRPVGFDYEFIRNEVLKKFPRVTTRGPHRGRKTRMSYKELQEFAGDLNRVGVRLPFRPFRPRRKLLIRSKRA